MSILAEMSKYEKTTLQMLTLDGKPLGLRACIYVPESDSFDYYDFTLSRVKSPEYKKFINEHKSTFSCEPLKLVNDLYMTQFEIDNNVNVKEFKTDEEADKCLSIVISVLKEQDKFSKGGVENG